MYWSKRCTNHFKAIGDQLALGAALLATFVIGSIGSFRGGLIAYILILAMWRILTCRDLTTYIFGVTGVTAAFSWLELADGRTDFTTALVSSVFALCVGLYWIWNWIHRE